MSAWRFIGPTTRAVIGVSGGLALDDVLLVAAKAMDRLGRPASDVLVFTTPGFATGNRVAVRRVADR